MRPSKLDDDVVQLEKEMTGEPQPAKSKPAEPGAPDQAPKAGEPPKTLPEGLLTSEETQLLQGARDFYPGDKGEVGTLTTGSERPMFIKSGVDGGPWGGTQRGGIPRGAGTASPRGDPARAISERTWKDTPQPSCGNEGCGGQPSHRQRVCADARETCPIASRLGVDGGLAR